MKHGDTECLGVFGRLFGHHFVGHYDITPPTDVNVERGSRAAVMEFVWALSKRTYICSVCVRCGETRANRGEVA